MKSTKEYTVSEVMMMASANGGIMNKCRNKIEFNNGVVYAYDFYSKKYHKVNAVTL